MKTKMLDERCLALSVNQAPQALISKLARPHAFKWVVANDQLLSFRLQQPAYVVALTGRHWMTCLGTDICLEQGYFTQLAPSTILLGGDGELALYLAEPEARPPARLSLLDLYRYFNFPDCTLKVILV
ncbi:hypothetical protein LT706_12250 [Pseudomonas syringae pv. syringae]|uniref:hypothetical protein n=1 Tax=Pseudomonas syringae TaxID=317 RepID=UPI00200A0DB1|nr:hypothetical protein [Pseudomonas syringae]MCK9712294.1 hypothetical protein [Pseudomonas syringae pv. syringae]